MGGGWVRIFIGLASPKGKKKKKGKATAVKNTPHINHGTLHPQCPVAGQKRKERKEGRKSKKDMNK
eukprot:617528-Pelagomonas_calceolata.AAC.2